MPAGHGARSAGALGSRLQLVLDEVVMMALERVWQGAGPSPTRQSPYPHRGAAAGFHPAPEGARRKWFPKGLNPRFPSQS